MFTSQEKSTGTQYTGTVASLIGAVVFAPAILLASHPSGYGTLSIAIACSAVCLGLAWFSWKKSELTIPSIEARVSRAK